MHVVGSLNPKNGFNLHIWLQQKMGNKIIRQWLLVWKQKKPINTLNCSLAITFDINLYQIQTVTAVFCACY